MAANQKKRQKQLERKKAKRKEKHQQLNRLKHRGLAEQMADAARAPILDCYISEDFWDQGMGYVLISRELPGYQVAVANFMVDRFCLGVKDVFARILTKGEYKEQLIARLEKRFALIAVKPADARKAVEEAVAYAQSLGLPPHPDYARAKPLLGDIDPAESTMTFEFGKDGKPFFFAGPYDTPERCRRIVNALEQACGKGQFHFTIPLSDPATGSFLDGIGLIDGDDDGEDDFEDEEERDEDPGFQDYLPGRRGS